MTMRSVDVGGLDIDSRDLFFGSLIVNGVDVVPFVDAELNRQFPGRERREDVRPVSARWDLSPCASPAAFMDRSSPPTDALPQCAVGGQGTRCLTRYSLHRMNENHVMCGGPEWAEAVRARIIPWALGDRDLGDDVLEVGPGYGATTDVFREKVAKLTAVEIDPGLAAALTDRLAART